jgi:hypothetical protein
MLEDVDTIHDLFDERLRSVLDDVDIKDYVRISTAIYEATAELRAAFIVARDNIGGTNAR